MAGASAVTFGQSGALTTTPQIVAASAVTFGQSGAITVPGSVAVAGSSAVTFGQTSLLSVSIPFAGTAATLFGQSGALTVTPQITGTSAVTFGQSGTVVLPGSVAVAGTSAVTFAQQATISTTVTFAGAGGWGDVNTGMGTGTRKQKRPVKKIKSFHELAQEMRAELMAEALGPVVQAKPPTQTKSIVQAKPYQAAITGEHDDDDNEVLEALIADHMMRLHSSFSILQHLMGGK